MTLSRLYPITIQNGFSGKKPDTVKSSKTEHTSTVSAKTLAQLKKAALRHGTWFRALNRIERGIIDLTVKYVDNIRSEKLAKVVTAIMAKLQLTMESKADRLARTIGIHLAKKISNIAVRWGNFSAAKWAEDHAFARYLAVSSAKSLEGTL